MQCIPVVLPATIPVQRITVVLPVPVIMLEATRCGIPVIVPLDIRAIKRHLVPAGARSSGCIRFAEANRVYAARISFGIPAAWPCNEYVIGTPAIIINDRCVIDDRYVLMTWYTVIIYPR